MHYLDNRDRLIDELSKTLEVTVTYTSKNAAIVRLGGSGSGPKIVEDSKRITLGLDEESTDIKGNTGSRYAKQSN